MTDASAPTAALAACSISAVPAPASPPAPPLSPPSRLSLCWALDLGAFRRSGAATGDPFDRLLRLCEPDATERARIMRFHFPQDRQRAAMGRILIRAALAKILDVPPSELHLSRSAYGKPYVLQPAGAERRVAFNLSHHGQYVVLAVEAMLSSEGGAYIGGDGASPAALPPLLGCDVTTCDRPRHCSSVSDYLRDMASCFTPHEWQIIRADDPSDPLPFTAGLDDDASMGGGASLSSADARALLRFSWLWSLKESLIKAIGMGLSFELQHIEFYFTDEQQTSIFSPVSVRFLGAPNFEVTTAAATTTATAASASSQPAPSSPSSSSSLRVRPPELANGVDVARDIRWTFASALLIDEQHIVSICWGHRVEQQAQQQTHAAAASTPAPLADPNASVFDVSQLAQLGQLGRCVSRRSASSSAAHLQVQQLSHMQMIPPQLQPSSTHTDSV